MTIVCHRSEMGQGIRSSLPVLIADELGAQMARVKIVQADGDKAYGDQNTDGSNSIRGIYEDMRRVGRDGARDARRHGREAMERSPGGLRRAGPRRSPISPPAARSASESWRSRPASRRCRQRRMSRFGPIAELPHLGKPLPLLDGPAYVTGQAIYGADIKLPGMLTAVIARPPVVGGKVARFDATRALAVPGVRKVIEIPPPKPPYAFQPWGGVAVVADHTWAAMRGRAALDVTWDHGPNASYDSAQYREALAKAVAAPGRSRARSATPSRR